MHVLDTNPTLAKHMLRALAQRLRRTNESLSDLVFSDVPGRVAKASWTLRTASAPRPTRASTSPTTSRRKSSPSWSVPPVRP